MTSNINDKIIRKNFEDNNYFGYENTTKGVEIGPYGCIIGKDYQKLCEKSDRDLSEEHLYRKYGFTVQRGEYEFFYPPYRMAQSTNQGNLFLLMATLIFLFVVVFSTT